LKNFEFLWSEEKNEKLQKERNISFKEIIFYINQNKVVDIIKNPSSNFDNQECFVIDIENYIWIVPYVKNKNEIFLKTAFPSRKHTKIYLNH
jgi:uncharacterized DUF497 family protein